jgi:hypothetical protein
MSSASASTSSASKSSFSSKKKISDVVRKQIIEKAGRSITGRKVGKEVKRGLVKNVCHLMEFVDMVTTSKTLFSDLSHGSITLGRVIRNMGADRLHVLALTFDAKLATEASVPISGALRFHGRSANKTDMSHCMFGGDLIVINGGVASAKLTPAIAFETQRIFEENDIRIPAGFFTVGSVAIVAPAAEEEDFEWDRAAKATGKGEEDDNDKDFDIGAI